MTSPNPLDGVRVVVTRPERQAASLAEALRREGAAPMMVPTIRFESLEDAEPVGRTLGASESYDWVCFTSQNGVRFARRALRRNGRDIDTLRANRLAAVGPATQRAIETLGLKVSFVPSPHLTRELGRQLPDPQDARVLLLRAEVASEELPQVLQDRGAHVDDVAIYRTVPNPSAREAAKTLSDEGTDWILFTSPSTVAAFAKLVQPSLLRRLQAEVPVAAIGPVTAAAAERHGFQVAVCAQTHTTRGLLDALMEEAALRA